MVAGGCSPIEISKYWGLIVCVVWMALALLAVDALGCVAALLLVASQCRYYLFRVNATYVDLLPLLLTLLLTDVPVFGVWALFVGLFHI